MRYSSSQINLAWTDSATNETGYYVERATSSAGPFSRIATLGAGSISYPSTGLASSTAYYYRLQAYNAAGTSAYSSTAVAVTPASVTVPAAPTGLSAAALSSSQINLTWTDSATNETGYYVEQAASSTGSFTRIATLGAGAVSYSNTGLAASTAYYYRVQAYNAGGSSSYSGIATATTAAAVTVPPAPLGLAATAVSASQIDLAWTDSSSSETGYYVERATASAGPFSRIATLGAGAVSYPSTGLASSTAYYYRLQAYNAAGTSAYSSTAVAVTPASVTVPAAPTGLSAAALSSSQINLTWSDSATNETGYYVERAASSTGSFIRIATLGAGAVSYSNTGLAASTAYYYRVQAYNAGGTSSYSGIATATTAAAVTVPPAPLGMTATAVSASQINLAWTDNSANEDGYYVERATASAGPFSRIATLGAGAVSYPSAGLAASTAYYYRLQAYNAAGHPYTPAPPLP